MEKSAKHPIAHGFYFAISSTEPIRRWGWRLYLFSILRLRMLLKERLFFLLFFLIVECQTPWYRKLPNEEKGLNPNLVGVWTKKTNPRSAINSSWHKNTWTEKIVLQTSDQFVKTYHSETWIGNRQILRKVEGFGTFTIQNNWILLETKTLKLIEKEDDKLMKNESKIFESSLLYYYYKEGNLIIPMIYDMGYEEKDFGVKDGVVIPYDEKSPNFFRFIKIYAFKEFQSHAYYPEN